jgi:hypothetical protein
MLAKLLRKPPPEHRLQRGLQRRPWDHLQDAGTLGCEGILIKVPEFD